MDDNSQELYRKAIRKCTKCYRKSTLAGQAFWNFECESCKKEKSHPNTDTPTICKDCSIEQNKCGYCLEPMD